GALALARVIDAHGDRGAACGLDKRRGLVDGLWTPVRRRLAGDAAARAVDRRAGFGERASDAAAGTAGCAGHEGHASGQRRLRRSLRRHLGTFCGRRILTQAKRPFSLCQGTAMSPRRRKAEDTDVFAAMVWVMLRVGPAQLTLGAIAAEAGVTAGALVQRLGRAARARYEQLLADAVVAGELRAGTDVRALARMIEVTLDGSFLAWTLYREGSAAGRLRDDLEATLRPYLVRGARRKRLRR